MIEIESFNDMYIKLKFDKKITNLKDFSLKSGYNYTYLSELKNKKKPLKHEFVRNINKIFSESFELLEKNNLQNEILSEPIETYSKIESKNDLADSIFKLIQNNEKLIDNNTKLVDTNAKLSMYVIELKKNIEYVE